LANKLEKISQALNVNGIGTEILLAIFLNRLSGNFFCLALQGEAKKNSYKLVEGFSPLAILIQPELI
jgi:hypothetical protein